MYMLVLQLDNKKYQHWSKCQFFFFKFTNRILISDFLRYVLFFFVVSRSSTFLFVNSGIQLHFALLSRLCKFVAHVFSLLPLWIIASIFLLSDIHMGQSFQILAPLANKTIVEETIECINIINIIPCVL